MIQRDQALTGSVVPDQRSRMFFVLLFERNYSIHAALLAVPGYNYAGNTCKPMEKWD